ncbi:hypothetical protein BDZ88DRAFT_418303 [Geranomyces variabilis]|nr:hypothetical protein BDZ88DRAFT_418303 [Geranomyces variabilis]KAJ3140569.1 hypothetical protein HDU90_007869 [Geranomyces variabilis]
MPSTAIQIPPRPPPAADNTAGTVGTAADQKTKRGAAKLFRRKLTGYRPDKESPRVGQERGSRRNEEDEDDGGVMGLMDDDISCSPLGEPELVSGTSSQDGEYDDDNGLVDDDELRSSSSISSSPLNPSFVSRRTSLLLISPSEPKRSSPIRRRNSTGTLNTLATPPATASNLASTPSASIPIDNDLCPPTPQNTPSEGSTMAQLSAHGLSDTKLLAIANALHAAAGMGSAATVHATTEVSSRVKNVHWAPHVDVHSEDDWLKQLHAYRKARKRLNRWRLTALFGTTV